MARRRIESARKLHWMAGKASEKKKLINRCIFDGARLYAIKDELGVIQRTVTGRPKFATREDRRMYLAHKRACKETYKDA